MSDILTEALRDAFDAIGTDAPARVVDVVIGAATIKASFQNDFISVNGEESMMPVLRCIDADVAAVAHGTTLTAAAVSYKVIGIQPNGNGTTTLILSKD